MDKIKLEEKVVNRLIEKKYTISAAESCTGGLFAAKIVNVPNASKVLNCSIVTYSNESKMKYANVSQDTLENFGAVSVETAVEMAKGIAAECSADVGVAVSGIAGPGGGSVTKPVGTVCFGFYINGKTTAYKKLFLNKTRNQIRSSSVKFALETLLKLL